MYTRYKGSSLEIYYILHKNVSGLVSSWHFIWEIFQNWTYAKGKTTKKKWQKFDNSHGNSNFLTNFITNTRNTELTYTWKDENIVFKC